MDLLMPRGTKAPIPAPATRDLLLRPDANTVEDRRQTRYHRIVLE